MVTCRGCGLVFSTLREHNCTEGWHSVGTCSDGVATAVAKKGAIDVEMLKLSKGRTRQAAEPTEALLALDVRRASAAERLQQAYEAAQLSRTHWTRGVDRVGRPARAAVAGPRRKPKRGGPHSTRLVLEAVSSPPFRASRPFQPPAASSGRGDGAAAVGPGSPGSSLASDAAGVRTYTHPLQDHLCGGAVLHAGAEHNGEIVATVPGARKVPLRRLYAGLHCTPRRTAIVDTGTAAPAGCYCMDRSTDERTAPREAVIGVGAVGEEGGAGVEYPMVEPPVVCCCAVEPSRPDATHRKPYRPKANEAMPPALPYLFEGDLDGDLGEIGHACHSRRHSGVAECGGLAIGADPSATDVAAVCCPEPHQSLAKRPSVPEALPTDTDGSSTAGLFVQEGTAVRVGAGATRLKEELACREDAPLSQTSTRGNAPPVLTQSLKRCSEAGAGHARSVERQTETPPPASGLSPEAERVAPWPRAAQPSDARPRRPHLYGRNALPLQVVTAEASGGDRLASPRRSRAPLDSPAASVRALLAGVGTPPAEPAGRTPPTTFVRMVETVEHLLHQLEGPALDGIEPASACMESASAVSPARSEAVTDDKNAETCGAGAGVRAEGGSGSAAFRLEDYLAAFAAAETPQGAGGSRMDGRRTQASGGSLSTPATQPLFPPPGTLNGQAVYLQHIWRRAAAGGGAELRWGGADGPSGAATEQTGRGPAGSPALPEARQAGTLAASDAAGANGVRAHATEAVGPGVGQASASNAPGERMGAAEAMGPALIESELGPLSELRRAQAKDLLRRMRALAAAPDRRTSRADGERAAAAAEVERRIESVQAGTTPQQPRPIACSSAGDAATGWQGAGRSSSLLEPRAGTGAFPPQWPREAAVPWSDGRTREPQPPRLSTFPPPQMSALAPEPDRGAPSRQPEPAVRMSMAAKSAEHPLCTPQWSPHPPLSTPPEPPVAAAPARDALAAFLTCSSMAAIASAAAPPSAEANFRNPRLGPHDRSYCKTGDPSQVWNMAAAPPAATWLKPPAGVPQGTAHPATGINARWTPASRPNYACHEARAGCAAAPDLQTASHDPQPGLSVSTEAGCDSTLSGPFAFEESNESRCAAATAGLTALHSSHAVFHPGRVKMERGSEPRAGCGSEKAFNTGCVGRATGCLHCGAETSRSQLWWPSGTPPLPGPAGRGGLRAMPSLAPTPACLAVPTLPDPLRGDTGSTGDWDAYTEALHDVYADFFAFDAAGITVRGPSLSPI